MTPYQLQRLERLEQFMDRLKLNSYIAKASAEGTRNPVLDYQDHERRLEQLERSGTVAKAPEVNPRTGLPRPDELTRRVNALEAHVRRLDSRADRLDEHWQAAAARDAATVAEGSQVIAKAQQAARRNSTPEGLLRRAEQVISDPTTIGAVAGYIQMGQLAKAQELVSHAEAQRDQAEENAALEEARQGVGGDVVQRLTDELEQSKSVITALLQRVGKLEAAQQRTPAPTPARTVAKAQAPRRGERHHDEMPTAQEILVRADGVVSSPVMMGQISSLVQGGKLAEALKVVEAAELAHESRLKSAQRRALR